MSNDTPQSALWRGDFGDSYVARNAATAELVRQRVRVLADVLRHTSGAPPRSILECGCNVGMNLRAFPALTGAELFALEPNAAARQVIVDDGVLPADHLFDATLGAIPLADGAVDFAFTSGVLIHVAPDDLEQAYREMHRVSARYLMFLEYFSRTPETLEYRGHKNALFKRDFGGMCLDLFPDLIPVAQGFCWERVTGLDDSTWWLFQKP